MAVLLWADVPDADRLKPEMLRAVAPGSQEQARRDIAKLLHPETQCPAAVHCFWSQSTNLYQPCTVRTNGKLCARHRRLSGDTTPNLNRVTMLRRLRGVCRMSRITTLAELAEARPGSCRGFGHGMYAFVQQALAAGETADLEAGLYKDPDRSPFMQPCTHCGGTGIEPVDWT